MPLKIRPLFCYKWNRYRIASYFKIEVNFWAGRELCINILIQCVTYCGWIKVQNQHIYLFFYPSDKIATGSFDKTCKLWSVETGKCYHTFRGHTAEIVSTFILLFFMLLFFVLFYVSFLLFWQISFFLEQFRFIAKLRGR